MSELREQACQSYESQSVCLYKLVRVVTKHVSDKRVHVTDVKGDVRVANK